MITFKSLAANALSAIVLLFGFSGCDKLPADPDVSYEGNLVHYFPFSGNSTDEVSGQTYDAHGGTYLSDRKGVEASAIFFNGFSTWMDLGANLGAKEGTLSFWIFPCLCKEHNPLFVKKSVETDPEYGKQYVGYSEAGEIETSCEGKWDVKTGVVIQANRWYHLAFRWEDAAGTIDIFVNGKKVQTVEYDAAPDAGGGSEPTYVGKILNKSKDGGSIKTVYYKGKLDEVRLYNKALPYSEIKALYTE